MLFLQSAGLIKIFSDSIESDTHDRPFECRLIQCALVRGYMKAQQAILHRLVTGKVIGRSARHGTHALSVASALEAAGPKGSTIAKEHEFSIPGLYTCPDGELAPLSCGTRARIVMQHSEEFDDNCVLTATPATQFLFRGEETAEGQAQLKVKSFCGTISTCMRGITTSTGQSCKCGLLCLSMNMERLGFSALHHALMVRAGAFGCVRARLAATDLAWIGLSTREPRARLRRTSHTRLWTVLA